MEWKSNYLILFRPGKPGSTATGRGVLSLNGLSYGVVRVDKEGSVTSLTLQDCGTVPPGGKVEKLSKLLVVYLQIKYYYVNFAFLFPQLKL